MHSDLELFKNMILGRQRDASEMRTDPQSVFDRGISFSLDNTNLFELHSTGKEHERDYILIKPTALRPYPDEGQGSGPDTFQWPDHTDPIQGAAVLNPIPGFHNGVIVVDFQSLYPTCIEMWGLCFTVAIAHWLALAYGLKEAPLQENFQFALEVN